MSGVEVVEMVQEGLFLPASVGLGCGAVSDASAAQWSPARASRVLRCPAGLASAQLNYCAEHTCHYLG